MVLLNLEYTVWNGILALFVCHVVSSDLCGV